MAMLLSGLMQAGSREEHSWNTWDASASRP
jgi:hypothetical protein